MIGFGMVAGFVWAVVMWKRRKSFGERRRLAAMDGRHRDLGGQGSF